MTQNIVYVVYSGSAQVHFNARLAKTTIQNNVYIVYPRTAQAHFNTRTPTWLNQKGYTTFFTSMTLNIVYVVYPRSTQAHFNARTATWLKKKGYTTLFTCDSKYCLCCISQEHSGTIQFQDSYLPERKGI